MRTAGDRSSRGRRGATLASTCALAVGLAAGLGACGPSARPPASGATVTQRPDAVAKAAGASSVSIAVTSRMRAAAAIPDWS
ncbi:hypothetical protein OMK64_19640, partial [Cellulomonas fimi]|uniref:hypothetical protein n=1 Tax=Cellulomonas fimi TaxID=1708 RepID=UPI00234D9441